jgi:hypothetical protein
MKLWSRGVATREFGFYLYAEQSGSRVTALSPQFSVSSRHRNDTRIFI